MRTQRTTKGNRDACSSCSCDRELHRYLRNFGGGGFEHPKPPSVRHWAPAHFALSVRVVLNEHFPGRWIGRGSPTSPAPLPWPPRSPDLITPHNSLWGIIKGKVAARDYNNNNEDLRRAMEDAFHTITPKMLRRMSQRTWRRIRLCPASSCTYGFTGNITKAYVSDSNQIHSFIQCSV